MPLPLILLERSGVQSELANWFGKDFAKLNIALQAISRYKCCNPGDAGTWISISIRVPADTGDPDLAMPEKTVPEITAGTVIAWRRNIPYAQAVLKFIDEINAFQA